ncbi:MAG: crossover junction endodeoxyribonuclease RuvC [Armatimonadota bacterium]
MIVLGIDPGLSETGYAILEAGDGSLRLRHAGCVRTKSRQPMESRVRAVYDELLAVASEWRPEVAVLEGLYSEYAYPRTAILMGHVRGVICLAADQAGARVLELSPAEVKQALTGSGRASKEQIKRAVTRMLWLKEAPDSEHICDALALALVGAAREGVDLWKS